ncbi:hypothetical protein F4859DRAFT_528594 [Xylaria cf. heliscus]|nr:hypothetical protein F4859DRAFT_528594 [Xylaria cf. heliscus]
MSLENSQDTPTQIESFHDTLTELLSRLAFVNVDDIQQKTPSGSINEPSDIRQFQTSSGLISDFAEVFGIPLPDVLWAFSLIFSLSRCGSYVVASVLREQPQDQDPEKSLFILYLTINKGTWRPSDEAYKTKWQVAVDSNINETMPSFPDLWSTVTQKCRKRITDYAKQVNEKSGAIIKGLEESEQFLLKSCRGTSNGSSTAALSTVPTLFPIFPESLFEEIKQHLAETSKVGVSKLLTEECWNFLNEHGDPFQKLFAHQPANSSAPEVKLSLKTIENFAKLPRALCTYLKFREVLISRGARLRIELLHYSHNSDHGPFNASMEAVKSKISKLTSRNVTKIIEDIEKKRKHPPHCEIQMLQYFDEDKDKSGVWNVIGCSKRQCLACAKLLRASDFLFKESHGKAYFQQLLSIETWLEGNAKRNSAITALNQELAESINRKRNLRIQTNKEKGPTEKGYIEPDSPIRQDYRLSTLRKLHLFDSINHGQPVGEQRK